jgi:sRNA-binding carbon storage regulator CsrA
MQVEIERKLGEAVLLQGGIYCRVSWIGRNRVRLQFTAPDGTWISRGADLEEEVDKSEEVEG